MMLGFIHFMNAISKCAEKQPIGIRARLTDSIEALDVEGARAHLPQTRARNGGRVQHVHRPNSDPKQETQQRNMSCRYCVSNMHKPVGRFRPMGGGRRRCVRASVLHVRVTKVTGDFHVHNCEVDLPDPGMSASRGC